MATRRYTNVHADQNGGSGVYLLSLTVNEARRMEAGLRIARLVLELHASLTWKQIQAIQDVIDPPSEGINL